MDKLNKATGELKKTVSLYRDGVISLGRASKISGLPMVDFIAHLGSLGIEIVRYDETVQQETQDVSAWLLS